MGTYVVKSGDNLSRIAQNNDTQTSALLRLNPGLSRNRLKPGQKITLG